MLPTQRDLRMAKFVFFAAAPGVIARVAYGLRIATGAFLTVGTSASDSALPGIGSFTPYPLTPYPLTPLHLTAVCVQAALAYISEVENQSHF